MTELHKAKETDPGFEFARVCVDLSLNHLAYGASEEAVTIHEMRDTLGFLWDVKSMRAGITLDEGGITEHDSDWDWRCGAFRCSGVFSA